MPSRLFAAAASRLGAAERRRLRKLRDELRATGQPSDRQLVANLESEAHLVGDRDFGDADALVSFLRTCASPSSKRRGAATCYRESCGGHQVQGLQIPAAHLPAGFLRYTTSRQLASAMVERVLGTRARDDFDADLRTDDLFSELAAEWDSSLLDGLVLGRSRAVFATFEHPAGAPRHDARALSQALTLPIWSAPGVGGDDHLLVELSYPASAIPETRFPTVADAGLIHLFRPAPEVRPDPADAVTCCGWTAPIGLHPAQPEIVHTNVSATILDRPPRFVGRVTP